MFKIFTAALLAFAAAMYSGSARAAIAPLTPSTAYNITISKMNPNGTVTDVETVAATTNSAGKLDFSLTSMPTKDDVNFIVLTLKNASGTVVRRAVMPAPPPNDTNKVGINDLATTQADALIATAAAAGTDDPILMAYELVILRSPNVTPADIVNIVTLGRAAIIGAGPSTFEGYLVSKGLTATDLNNLKKCLIYNPDPTKNTMREFSAGFYRSINGVDANGNSAAPADELQRTGGIMADIFIDASACANIDLTMIQMAHEAAGDGATNSGALAAMGANLTASIDQSMSAFHQKMAMVKVAADYTNALSTLGATGAQIDRFLSAVNGMATANKNIDKVYGGFYNDPAGYAAAHSTTINAVMAAMQVEYSNSWTAFQTAIASTNGEIAALKVAVLAAHPGLTLPPDFGGYTDQNGTRVNWPLPQTVMVAWINTLSTFSYTPRDTTPIPTMQAMWMGSCSVMGMNTWNKSGCEMAGGTWTAGRNTFSSPSSTFNAYLALQEDMNIVDMAKNEIWSLGNQPTKLEQQAAKDLFMSRMATITSHISGISNGAALTTAQKNAIIRLMVQPNL